MSVTINGTNGLVFNDNSTQNTSPFTGGFGFRNRIINGAMVIDQRNAGASVTITTAEQFITDRWQFAPSVSSKLTGQQSSVAPTGFSNSLLFTSSAATSVSASDYYFLQHKVEGFNFADMSWGTANAQTVTLSFWVRSSITGTYGGALVNSAQDRSYPFSYTISVANTWEQKTITVAGDTTGTWVVATNGTGVRLRFGLGVGSTYSGTANAWAASNLMSVTGATNWIGTSGATFYITGVQLEKGSTATSFDYRPYGTELALCQRYCFAYRPTGAYMPYLMAHGISTTAARGLLKFPQTMRVYPTLSFTAANTFLWSFGNAATSIALAEYGTDQCSVDFGSTGLAANGGYMLTSNNSTSSYIIGSAEL